MAALAIFGVAATATGLVASYEALLVTRFFVGFGEGFVWLAFGIFAAFGPWFAWVLSLVPRNHAGPATALVTFCGNFGGIVGPIVVGAVAGDGDIGGDFYVLGYFLLAASVIAFALGQRAASSATLPAPLGVTDAA